jgi:hypothetical protein
MRFTYNLLFTVFLARNQIDGFHMANVDLVPQYVGEDDLRDVSALNV